MESELESELESGMMPTSNILVIHTSQETAGRIKTALATIRDPAFANAKVSSAVTLADALRVLDRESPKVILVGLQLPDSSGLSTLRAVRSKCPGSPMIVLLDGEDHTAGAAGLGSGAQDYLFVTEIRGDVIERAMRRAIERRRVEEQHADTGWRLGVGETALGVLHEINNPLASLMLNLEMLKEGGQKDADELIGGIEIAAKRITAMVRRLEGIRTPQRVPAIAGEAMVDLSGGDSIPKAAEPIAEGAERIESPVDCCTILLVDDEKSVRTIVTKILSRHGHKVLGAEHGAAALRLAAAYDGKIDLLITDVYMPGLRGPEILEWLRPTHPGIHVLFMSGYGDEDMARSGVDPASSFLRKPFTVQELSEAVRNALAQSSEGVRSDMMEGDISIGASG